MERHSRPEDSVAVGYFAILSFNLDLGRTQDFPKTSAEPSTFAKIRQRSPILRNGSAAGFGGNAQLLQLQQHRERSFQLSIEVDLVPRQPFEPIRLDSLAESLRTDQRSVIKLALPLIVPRQDLDLQNPLQALGVGTVRRLVLVVIVRLPGELLFSPFAGIFAQRRQRVRVRDG